MARNVTVRAKALGGQWETIGAERASGVWPENFTAGSDGWGNSTASFDLRRDSAVAWPDVSAYTDVEVEEDGIVVWEGRTKETPAREAADGQVLNVQCEGWQAHLDDDMYQKTYVHNTLSAWVDARTMPTQDLTAFQTIGKTQTGAGALSFGWAKDDAVPTLCHVGLTLDLGYWNLAKGIAFDLERIGGGGAGFVNVVVRGHSTATAIPPVGSYEDVYVHDTSTIATPSTITATFTNSWRYVTILAYNQSGAPFTLATDFTMTIKGARIATLAAYLSAGASVLTADTVIKDALDTSAPLLSTDRTQIVAPGFNIASLAADAPRTPREYISGVNAYHAYRTRIRPGRIFEFSAQPSAPVVEVGEWSTMEFQDASSNSGQDLYNRVFVTAPAADGSQISLKVSRDTTTDLLDVANGVSFANPSFDTVTTGWAVSGGALTRDTVDFHSTPASLKWVPATAAFGTLTSTMTGTFLKGTPYVITFWYKNSESLQAQLAVVAGGAVVAAANTVSPTSWTQMRLAWTPTADTANPTFRLLTGDLNPAQQIRVDDFAVNTLVKTLLDRRGIIRTYQLSVAATLPSDGVAARQIASVWLDQHKTTPFRGTLTIGGDQSIREVSSGRYLRPSALLGMTGELIRLSDRIDPDTGGFGRNGIIAGVSYTAATNQATVTLDNTRSNLDALLARLSVISGG